MTKSSLCCPRPGEGRFPPSISGLLPFWCLGQYMPNVFRRQHPACLNIAKLCVILQRQVHHWRFRSLRQFDLAGFPWEQPRWDLFFKCMYTKDVQGGQLVLPALCPPNPVPRSPFQLATAGNTSEGTSVTHVCAKCHAPHPFSSCRQKVSIPNTSKS